MILLRSGIFMDICPVRELLLYVAIRLFFVTYEQPELSKSMLVCVVYILNEGIWQNGVPFWEEPMAMIIM